MRQQLDALEEIMPEEKLDDVTKTNLENVVEYRLKNEFDFVLLIVSKVGNGKSMLSALCQLFISKLLEKKFDIDHIFFTVKDYRMFEGKLNDKDGLDFDEGEEVFFSRRAMTKDQQKMILDFAQIRQRNFFITICAPSLFLLEKWLRGVGKETRVDAVFKIERRGCFSVYSSKTGSLQKIKIDPILNDVKYPKADYYGFWKPIPKTSKFWQEYLKKKQDFLSHRKESKKLIEQRMKMEKKFSNSFSIRDIAELQHVKEVTVRKWLNIYKLFPKQDVFIDMAGHIRITSKGYEIAMRRLERQKRKNHRKIMSIIKS